MKKSAMVALLHNRISSILLTDLEFDLNDCERLLDEIVDRGMRPPAWEDEKGNLIILWEDERKIIEQPLEVVKNEKKKTKKGKKNE